jgi:hypothetical protein
MAIVFGSKEARDLAVVIREESKSGKMTWQRRDALVKMQIARNNHLLRNVMVEAETVYSAKLVVGGRVFESSGHDTEDEARSSVLEAYAGTLVEPLDDDDDDCGC